jgi:hypothetical protein
LNSKPRIIWVQRKDLGLRNFEFDSGFKFKRRFEYFFKNGKYKGDFEVLSELENLLGSGMKFESSDLIQIEGYSKSMQGLT